MALLLTIVFCVFLRVGFSCNVSCNCSKNGTTLGYYWRDYFGHIPYDAVQGGIDKNGNPTYIGQVFSNTGDILPGTITSGCSTITISDGSLWKELDKNIKILCSDKHDKLSWIATQSEKMSLLTNCHLVVGGLVNRETVFIGRVNFRGQTIIGKVLDKPFYKFGFFLPNDKDVEKFMFYEILTYNCIRPATHKMNLDFIAVN